MKDTRDHGKAKIRSTFFICRCFVNNYHHPNENQKADDVLVKEGTIIDQH